MYKIAITGAGGFIGTQVAYVLDKLGYSLTLVDRKFKHRVLPGILIEQDYLDFFRENTLKYDCVIHLAADHEVEQSTRNPSKYYENNVQRMKSFLDCMVATDIDKIIFSSTASIYGRQGAQGLLQEDMFYDPENAYAGTKSAGEMLIKDYAKAYGLKYVIFRYFNAAGADPDLKAGYVQRPMSHVVPILCNAVLNNLKFKVYGNDYRTPDGTCVRDYIHVADIASAHGSALDYILSNNKNEIFNVGRDNQGASIIELLDCFKLVTGTQPDIEYASRRAGDPASLIADTTKIQRVLNWKPSYSLEDIVMHAWQWEQKFQHTTNLTVNQ